MEVKLEVIYDFEWYRSFRPHMTFKGQGQTLKTLTSIMSKTVRDREKVEVR